MKSDVVFQVSSAARAIGGGGRGSKSPQKNVWRARIVLMTADGLGTMAIARRTGTSKPTV